MKKSLFVLALLALLVGAGSYTVFTQGGGGGGQQAPAQPMSFFITSANKGDGANYGGIAGADAHCAMLAKAAGSAKTQWRAYLSTQGAGVVNARDRIGSGPWYNSRGAMVARNLSHLHGDTLDEARLGSNLARGTGLDEKQQATKGQGDMPNEHDILTGSQPDGRAFADGMDHTCNNYTSNAAGTVQMGHFDRTGGGNASWNSAHGSKGCSQANLVSTGGAGKVYCFALD